MKKCVLMWVAVLGLMVAMLLPTLASDVGGGNLREAAVAQGQFIANVPWTMENRVAKANVTGERLDAFNNGGIFPTTYFEYSRLRFPIRGVMVESNTGTVEQFMEMFDPATTKVEGHGHVPDRSYYVGMDINAFIADVIARVSPTPVTSLKQALTDDSLELLMEGVNLSAASSKAAVGGMNISDASVAYDKLQKGDLLLAWDDNADTAVSPRIHALLVEAVDSVKDEVTVIYPSYNLLLWHLECEECGTRDTYGPSSAALPEHVNSVNYAFASFKRHSDTYPDAGCNGAWKPVYASSWYTRTVSYSDLLGAGVPSGSVCYLPYTLDVYSNPVEPKVEFAADATAETLVGGFAASITSNYRITGVEAVLKQQGGESRTFTSYAASAGWAWEYSDNKLNQALMECAPGSYELTVNVLLGTTEKGKSAFQPIGVFQQAFSVAESSFMLCSDKTQVEQGEPFAVSLTTLEDGYTGVSATLLADVNHYVFDVQASQKASPNTVFTQQTDGGVKAEYYGAALSKDSVAIQFVFAPVRTGGWGASEGIVPFRVSSILASKKAGASREDLCTSRAGGNGFVVAIGRNTQVFRDYVKGYDLVLAYMMVDEMRNQSGNTKLKMSYDGNPMYDVTTSYYNINGNSWLRIYGYITPNADTSKIEKSDKTSPELKYSNDVNQSGHVDITDVQAIANIRNGRMPLEGNMIKWLMADIDRNGVVDMEDQEALVRVLTG